MVAAWRISFVANSVSLVAYAAVSLSILVPVLRSRRVQANFLGIATAAVFLVVGLSRGVRAVRVMLPSLGYDSATDLAARSAIVAPWILGLDAMVAVAGGAYLLLRARYGAWMHGAGRYADLKVKQQQGLQAVDGLVQGLVVAETALALDQREMTKDALADTLAAARRLIGEQLGSPEGGTTLGPGDLRRDTPLTSGQHRLEQPPASSSDGAQHQVLVVDDSEDFRLLVRMILESDGRFQVVGEASNGVEAIESAMRLRPDIVLLDIVMPVMDGMEALPRIVANAPESEVVVVCGFRTEDISATVTGLGAASFLEKSDIANRLIPHLSEVVSNR